MNNNTDLARQNPTARLALSSGHIFPGRPFGAMGKGLVCSGEQVFNTAMSGYQESLTDPSYMGQILVQTQPLIGNTGVNPDDTESQRVQVAGFVIHEYTEHASNYRQNQDLDTYLRQADILGIAGVDTRALTRTLRSGGVVQAILTDRTDISDQALIQMAQQVQSMSGQNLASLAGIHEPCEWSQNLGDWGGFVQDCFESVAPTVLVFDYGIKSNIPRSLAQRGLRVRLIPQDTTSEQIKSLVRMGHAHALFLSNGPGDPQAVTQSVQVLRDILNDAQLKDLPIFGICLGHQLLCLAMGAQTYKLPFGHRGANHPVHDLERGRIEITSQNHGFAVEPNSIEAAGGVITHIHLNDGTVAGFRHRTRPVYAVQFHPEASPGPHDANTFFDHFVARIKHASMTPIHP